jgi:hypothetical protein
MKYLMFCLVLMIIGFSFSCKSEQSNSNQTVPIESGKKSQSSEKADSNKYADCRQLPLGGSSLNKVNTQNGEAIVWNKENKEDFTSELFYTLNSGKPILLAKTQKHANFSEIDVSPDGNWARAIYNFYPPKTKNTEVSILINLKENDFTKWIDIDKRIGFSTNNKLHYNSCWQSDKPATIIYLKLDETKGYLDLPNKMPTVKQQLDEALNN